ncbi:hypothetical protein J7M22_08510 [Candidatus Poribacteria bacterium]|nr:hypothetical protein [Candidatus Poribacteria bacterium]
MSEVVIANAGPLMALAKLNLLHLLKQLYGQVQFPRSVYEEAVVEGIRRGFEDAHTLQQFLNQENWKPIEVKDIPDDIASSHLDRGERESIAFLSAPRLNVNSEDYLTYIAFQVKRKPHLRLTGY